MGTRVQLRRLVWIARVAVAHACAHLVVRGARWWPWLVARMPLAKLSGPQRLRRLLEDMGGAFIKFGQMLALQPDIVSLEYCDELFNLMDRIAPFPYEQVEQVFREELDRGPDELFTGFDRTPIATASIGQVHLASLGGRRVAVKVQRPTANDEFQGDIRLMSFAMAAIRRFHLRSLFWTLEPMGEFVAWTGEELDYRQEARYADRLHRNAARNPVERVPAIEWDLTTRRTLVMDFVAGTTVLDCLRAWAEGDEWLSHKLRASRFDPDVFAQHVIENFLGDAFQYGVFHADLHPANLLVLPDNVVGYVDFGITGVLSRFSRRHLIAMTLAYTQADLVGMAESFSKLTVSDSDADPWAFREGLAAMSEGWYDRSGSSVGFKKNFTLVMLDMLMLSRKTGIWPERDVIKYIRSAIAVDGLITRFAPGFSVGRHLALVCQRWMTWEVRRAALSYDSLMGAAMSNGHLIESGAARMTTVLRRFAEGDMTARLSFTQPADASGALRRQALRLVGMVIGIAALIQLSGGTPQVGVNLFTAEMLLMVSAVGMLVRSVRKLTVAD
jgi:ubiquinone biosynthesis protein